MENIYINMPKRQYLDLKTEIDRAMIAAADSGKWFFGESSDQFAAAFAEYSGAALCLPVANGTDALELALRALDLEPGAECMTVANAGGYTATACTLTGLVPHYIDINADDHLLNLDLVLSELGEQTKVIVATHLYGNVVDVKSLKERLAQVDRSDIKIVEDCAQCHGGKYPSGEPVGHSGDIATFSFYPTKNLGAIGDGGALTTNCDQLFGRLKELHQYGWSSRYANDLAFGRNSRMDEIQAAILAVKLPHLAQWNQRRQAIVARYHKELGQSVKVISTKSQNCVAHLAIFEHPRRDEILEQLKAKGIFGDIHYPKLDFEQKAWKDRDHKKSEMPVSLATRSTIFTLPCFPEMTNQELDYICATVREFLN